MAANDSYFSPAFSRQLADAFRSGRDSVDFQLLPASGSEGHWLVETEAGLGIAGPKMERALQAALPKPGNKR